MDFLDISQDGSFLDNIAVLRDVHHTTTHTTYQHSQNVPPSDSNYLQIIRKNTRMDDSNLVTVSTRTSVDINIGATELSSGTEVTRNTKETLQIKMERVKRKHGVGLKKAMYIKWKNV